MTKAAALFALVSVLLASSPSRAAQPRIERPTIVVLGIAQDGGLPQAGCKKKCCTSGRREDVSSLALVDPASNRWWLFDATPDLPRQMERMAKEAPSCSLAGVFVTHAHIGHYTGLMHFGREVMGSKGMPVWTMPRMRTFLTANGPWSQLVKLGNVELKALAADVTVRLDDSLLVTPFIVPHRDEFSETVGFRINGPRGSVVYLPDIDKWERWERRIDTVVQGVDVAFVDGTFFDGEELVGRDMREIPHPFVVETLDRFAPLAPEVRARLRFIHMNHTNGAMLKGSPERIRVERSGARVAQAGDRVTL